MDSTRFPLLPLVLAHVPVSLLRALEQEGVPTVAWSAEAAAGRFVLYDSKRGACPALHANQRPIDVHLLRSPCEDDAFAALDDERAVLKSWRVGGLEVTETVARVDKRALRARLMHELRQLIERAGGVWMRVAAFPYPYRSAFNFRLDHDHYIREDFERFNQASRGYEDCLSHFVNGAAFQGHRDALRALLGQDVGSHAFHHHTYVDAAENHANIARGIALLRSAGFEPSGFVSPLGRYNRGLSHVLEQLGVSHSSEFALAYDDWPFYPSGSRVLQLPVHPICLGIVLEAAQREWGEGLDAQRRAADAMAEYFRWIASSKYQAGEPIFLYGHPDGRLGRWPHVWQALLGTVDEFAAVWRTTMTEFARWWRERQRVRFRVEALNDHYVVHVEQALSGYRFGIEYWRGEHVAPMPLDRAKLEFSPQALAFQGRRPRAMPDQLRIDPPQSVKQHLLRYLDWEKATPADEIATGSLRGFLKRTLRRWRS